MTANRVRERTSTTGTGALVLTGATAGHSGFSDAFAVGESFTYCIEDGADYEIGLGSLAADGSLLRQALEETLVAGVVNRNTPMPLSLTGGADVFATLSQDSLNTRFAGKADSVHSHDFAEVTGLQTALDAKASITHLHDTQYAPLVHGHIIGDITGLQAALDGKADSAHSHSATYAPLVHSHDIIETTGLQAALDTKIGEPIVDGSAGQVLTTDGIGGRSWTTITAGGSVSSVDGKVGAVDLSSDYAPTLHSHSLADISGLQIALDSRLIEPAVDGAAGQVLTTDGLGGRSWVTIDTSGAVDSVDGQTGIVDLSASYASIVHTHSIADITGLDAALSSKAPSAHSHVIADISGLQTALDSKADAAITLAALDTKQDSVAGLTGQVLTIQADGSVAAETMLAGAPSSQTVSASTTISDTSSHVQVDASASGGEITLLLTAPTADRVQVITDSARAAKTRNIRLIPPAGWTLMGEPDGLMTNNGESWTLYFDVSRQDAVLI